MSLSDSFMQGLSAPVPVAGAGLPDDLTLYAGGPLDPLKQHEEKYKQLAHRQRMSDRESKKMLAALAEAENDYGNLGSQEDDMGKVGFVSSNPVLRRQYLMKMAYRPSGFRDETSNDEAPQANGGSVEVSGGTEVPAPAAATPSALTPPLVTSPTPEAPEAPPIPTPVAATPPALIANDIEGLKRQRPTPTSKIAPTEGSYAARYNQGQGQRRYVGPQAQDLGTTGGFLDKVREFNTAYTEAPVVQGGQPSDQSWGDWFKDKYEGAADTLGHYGTRAVRAGTTGAQMLASKAYEGDWLGARTNDNWHLDPKEMAQINASLSHAYRGDAENTKLYGDRYRDVDVDPKAEGIQHFERDLLDYNTFRDRLVEDEVARSDKNIYSEGTDSLTEDELKLRTGREAAIRARIDNIYGAPGNQMETPAIGEDLSGRPFRRALSEAGDYLTNPAAQAKKQSTLEQILAANPEVAAKLNSEYGDKASEAGMSLTQYLARELKSTQRAAVGADGVLGTPDDVLEEDDARLQRYEVSRRVTDEALTQMKPEDRMGFLKQVNPGLVQQAQKLSDLPDAGGIEHINNMDPLEAKIMLDQISMLSRYVSPETKQDIRDYSGLEKYDDADDTWFNDWFGTDVINPAGYEVGQGTQPPPQVGDEGRRRVYGYNSMRDTPGRWYRTDDGWLWDNYYNAQTGETNRELGTDFGDWATALRNRGSGAPIHRTSTPITEASPEVQEKYKRDSSWVHPWLF